MGHRHAAALLLLGCFLIVRLAVMLFPAFATLGAFAVVLCMRRNGQMVETIAAYFGTRINTAYAEPFYSHEMLGFGGLDQLI